LIWLSPELDYFGERVIYSFALVFDLYRLFLRAFLLTCVMTLMTDFREKEFEDAERLEG
jgi:hypothetical protein